MQFLKNVYSAAGMHKHAPWLGWLFLILFVPATSVPIESVFSQEIRYDYTALLAKY